VVPLGIKRSHNSCLGALHLLDVVDLLQIPIDVFEL
jgi:hypothetical protein